MLQQLWQNGDLFHVFSRYSRKPGRQVDRLSGILKKGLVAPASCNEGTVCSDLNLTVTGLSVRYDSLVFLHRFGAPSWLYTISEPGRFAVFVDPELEVLTPDDLAPDWPVMSQDEVYVRNRVDVERLIGIAAHPADAHAVLNEFLPEFQRLAIPLFLYDGTRVWP